MSASAKCQPENGLISRCQQPWVEGSGSCKVPSSVPGTEQVMAETWWWLLLRPDLEGPPLLLLSRGSWVVFLGHPLCGVEERMAVLCS